MISELGESCVSSLHTLHTQMTQQPLLAHIFRYTFLFTPIWAISCCTRIVTTLVDVNKARKKGDELHEKGAQLECEQSCMSMQLVVGELHLAVLEGRETAVFLQRECITAT